MSKQIDVRFWGIRGSVPTYDLAKKEYGGNTSCVSVSWNDGLAIFDAGSGINAMGQFLETEKEEGRFDETTPIHLFFSHLHLDHIVGLPLFHPLFWHNAEIHIYGMGEAERTFQERLECVISPPYWPICLNDTYARLIWHEISERDVWNIGADASGDPICVRYIPSDHPNECVLYRLDGCGESVVYGLDCEATDQVWDSYRTFADNCSLLIFDAAYTEKEYDCFRGFGHSYWQKGVEMAKQCHAKRLGLCHYDWKRTDCEINVLAKEMEESICGENFQASFIKEGTQILLGQEE